MNTMGQVPVLFDIWLSMLDMLYDNISNVYTDDFGFLKHQEHYPDISLSQAFILDVSIYFWEFNSHSVSNFKWDVVFFIWPPGNPVGFTSWSYSEEEEKRVFINIILR